MKTNRLLRRVCALALCAVLMAGLLPAPAHAADEKVYGTDRYQFDSGEQGDETGLCVARTFTSERDEMLTAVQVYTFSTNVLLEVDCIPEVEVIDSEWVHIYEGWKWFRDYPGFSSRGSATGTSAGWYTVSLNVPVELTEGKEFAVVIRATSTDGNKKIHLGCDPFSSMNDSKSFCEGRDYFTTFKLISDNGPNYCVKAVTEPYTDTRVPYLDHVNGTMAEKRQGQYTPVTAATTELPGGWYVVDGAVTVSGRLSVTGDAHVILKNGATLNANAGVSVNNGRKLTVYAQSMDPTVMGALNATATGGNAAIGGDSGNACGTVTIRGGVVTATTGSGAAGIGGGSGQNGGTVTITGGVVTASGGYTGIGGANGTNPAYTNPAYTNLGALVLDWADADGSSGLPRITASKYNVHNATALTAGRRFARAEDTSYAFQPCVLTSFRLFEGATTLVPSPGAHTYTVTWKDADGTVLRTERLAEGATPSYTGATPTKASTALYTYAFAGWKPTPYPVTSDETYTAVYDAALADLAPDGAVHAAEAPLGGAADQIALSDLASARVRVVGVPERAAGQRDAARGLRRGQRPRQQGWLRMQDEVQRYDHDALLLRRQGHEARERVSALHRAARRRRRLRQRERQPVE